MAYPILGIPLPQFFNTDATPLSGGTITVLDPGAGTIKSYYPTAADADAGTSAVSATTTLNARGEPPNQLWGQDSEDYQVIIKNSAGSSVYNWTGIRLPRGRMLSKIKTAAQTLTTTTLADDDHLVNYILKANSFYAIEGHLYATADAASRDLKIDFVVDNAVQDSSYVYVAVDAATAGTVDAGEVQAITSAVTIDIDGTSDVGVFIRGFIYTNASNETNLDLQVAQGTDAGTTTLKRGSWLKFEPLSI
jgi:hypothetical protein